MNGLSCKVKFITLFPVFYHSNVPREGKRSSSCVSPCLMSSAMIDWSHHYHHYHLRSFSGHSQLISLMTPRRTHHSDHWDPPAYPPHVALRQLEMMAQVDTLFNIIYFVYLYEDYMTFFLEVLLDSSVFLKVLLDWFPANWISSFTQQNKMTRKGRAGSRQNWNDYRFFQAPKGSVKISCSLAQWPMWADAMVLLILMTIVTIMRQLEMMSQLVMLLLLYLPSQWTWLYWSLFIARALVFFLVVDTYLECWVPPPHKT